MSEVHVPRSYEAPICLVEPARLVVAAGMERVREGNIDEWRRQRVTLKGLRKLFEITDLHAVKTPTGIFSKEDLRTGLLVYQINLGEDDEPISRGIGLQAPRDAAVVNPETIFLLRNIPPEKLTQLAADLSTANTFLDLSFGKFAAKLYKRELEH